MAYCTITEVEALNAKRTYSASTTPTSTQVETYIDLIAAEIDIVLSRKGYSVPVTTPDAFVNALKLVNAVGAAAMAEQAMFPEAVEKGMTPHSAVLQKKYDELLAKIEAGEWTGVTQAQAVGSFYTVSADQDSYPDPAFRKSADDLEF